MGFLAAIPGIVSAASGVGALVGGVGQNKQQAGVPQGQLQNYNPAINQAIGGLGIGQGQQQQIFGQESQLAGILGQQVMGQGPNLAETQLQAATDRNQQQAAGLIGSQKGMNPALAARQILEQQAQASQASANQAAQLRQQQQLMAQQQLSGLYGQQGQQALAQQHIQGGLVGTLGQLNNQQIGQQISAQNINSQAAQNNANMQAGQFGGLASGMGSALQLGLQSSKPQNIGPVANGDVYGQMIGKSDGGPIDGQAKKSGDSPENDTVPAMLSPGEFVIPRSIIGKSEQEIMQFIRENRNFQPKQRLDVGGIAGMEQPLPPEQQITLQASPNSAPAPETLEMQAADKAMQNKSAEESRSKYEEQLGQKALGQEPYEVASKGVKTIEQQGQLEAAQARRNIKPLSDYTTNVENLMKNSEGRQQQVRQFNDQMQRAILSNEIDPNKVWAHADTSSKLNSVIGIILGGLGQGMMRTGSNQALDLAKDIIRQDIEAQKSNVGRFQSLLSSNLQAGDSMNAATEHAMNNAMSAFQAQLLKNANATGDQAAILKAQAMTVPLEMEKARSADSARLYNAQSNIETKIIPTTMMPLLSPEQKKRTVLLGNGQIALSNTEEGAKEATRQLDVYQPVIEAIDKLDALPQSALIPGTAAYGQAQSYMKGIFDNLSQLVKTGRISQQSYDILTKQAHDPSDWHQMFEGKARNEVFRETMYNMMSSKLQHSIPAFKSANSVKGAKPVGR